MTAGIGNRMLRAAAWHGAGTFANRAIQFVITLVLARLLTPAEFGLVAVLTVFTLIANTLVESGFGAALIQKPEVTAADASAVFHFNMAMSGILYAVLWFLAEPIARFYGQPLLAPLARTVSAALVFNALGLVQGTLFARKLDFRPQSKALVLSTGLSGSIGIALATQGCGVWSLVAQIVANSACRALLLWTYSSWRPTLRVDLGALRAMLPYGSRLLASSLLGVLFENSYLMVIGRCFTKADVGFYSRSQLTVRLATDSLTGVIVNVSFPAYATLQDDPVALRREYRRTILHASAVLFPLMLGLAAMATPLFLFLYSEKWAPGIPYFRILCLSGMFFHVHAFNLNVLKAVGRSDLFLRLALVKFVLLLAGLGAALPFGLTGIVWGQVAVSWIGLAVNAFFAGRLMRYPLRDQLCDILPFMGTGALGAGLTYAASLGMGALPPWLQVALLVPLQAGLCLGLAFLVHPEIPTSVLRKLRELAPSRRS